MKSLPVLPRVRSCSGTGQKFALLRMPDSGQSATLAMQLSRVKRENLVVSPAARNERQQCSPPSAETHRSHTVRSRQIRPRSQLSRESKSEIQPSNRASGHIQIRYRSLAIELARHPRPCPWRPTNGVVAIRVRLEAEQPRRLLPPCDTLRTLGSVVSVRLHPTESERNVGLN